MIVFKAERNYEGRTTDSQLCETVELAKTQARNWVVLSEPPRWVDKSPEWDHRDEPKRLVMENASDGEVQIVRTGVLMEDE